MVHLSRMDLQNISKRVLRKYMNLPDIRGKEIYRIDPMLLATEAVGLDIDYAHLSYDGALLGLTSFSESIACVLDEDLGPLVYTLDGNTILIESDLKMDFSQRGRLHFTVAHETAHQVLNKLFPHDYENKPHIHCYSVKNERTPPAVTDWEEWQANVLASYLLMPKELVMKGMYLCDLPKKIHCLNRIYSPQVYRQFETLADLLGTSKKALAVTLKRYGLLDKEYLQNPQSLLDIEMEVTA